MTRMSTGQRRDRKRKSLKPGAVAQIQVPRLVAHPYSYGNANQFDLRFVVKTHNIADFNTILNFFLLKLREGGHTHTWTINGRQQTD